MAFSLVFLTTIIGIQMIRIIWLKTFNDFLLEENEQLEYGLKVAMRELLIEKKQEEEI